MNFVRTKTTTNTQGREDKKKSQRGGGEEASLLGRSHQGRRGVVDG